MIFVDTSVWIAFFRGKDLRLVQKLNQILDQDLVAIAAPVWIELLSGSARSESTQIKRLFSALPHYFPSEETWKRIETWVLKGLAHGQRFAAMDLLVASIAVDWNSSIWSLDNDFSRMASLRLIEIYKNSNSW